MLVVVQLEPLLVVVTAAHGLRKSLAFVVGACQPQAPYRCGRKKYNEVYVEDSWSYRHTWHTFQVVFDLIADLLVIEISRFSLVDNDSREIVVNGELSLAIEQVSTKSFVFVLVYDAYLCKRFPFVFVLNG